MSFFWEDFEVEALRKLWPVSTAKEIGKVLHRTPAGVQSKARELKLKKKNYCRRKWTNEERTKLVQMYKGGSKYSEIAIGLDRSEYAIELQKQKLHLTRPTPWKEVEDNGEDVLRSLGFLNIKKGGGNKAYDYLAERDKTVYSVNVKSGNYCWIVSGNLKRLFRYGIPIILWKSKFGWALFICNWTNIKVGGIAEALRGKLP